MSQRGNIIVFLYSIASIGVCRVLIHHSSALRVEKPVTPRSVGTLERAATGHSQGTLPRHLRYPVEKTWISTGRWRNTWQEHAREYSAFGK